MDLKTIAKSTAKTLVSYLTYQAVRVVIGQLRETNPPLCSWLHQFSSLEKIQDGDAYLSDLLRVNQDLAFRVMSVRAHLASEVMDFMPEMVQTLIQQSNMEYRKQYLERITQLTTSDFERRSDSQNDATVGLDTPDEVDSSTNQTMNTESHSDDTEAGANP